MASGEKKGAEDLEPQVEHATVSASVGGKVALVGFGGLSSDYHYSINRTYSIPKDWTEERVDEWQVEKAIELREKLEPIAQAEADELMGQSLLFNDDGSYVGD